MDLCINILFVRKYICSIKRHVVEFLFSLQTASVAYFQRKIQLSAFSAYPELPVVQIVPDQWSSTAMCKVLNVTLYHEQLKIVYNPINIGLTFIKCCLCWSLYSWYSSIWFSTTTTKPSHPDYSLTAVPIPLNSKVSTP